MTREEALMLSAYTGVLLVPDFEDVHRYCEELMGFPILTHEFAGERLQSEIREKLRPRVWALCQAAADDPSAGREQAEKAERMRGEWVKPNWRNSTSCAVCSQCGFEAYHHEYHGVQDTYLFCPRCMAPMTDEAVQLFLKRIEALRGGEDMP